MQENEDIKNIKGLIAIAICAILTWIWFDLNNSNDLPLIGHTNLVNGWINEYASKSKLLFDLVYFSVSIAIIIVLTDIALAKIELPFFGFSKDSCFSASIIVNLIVFIYEFHILEFKLKLIGLTIALIIFYIIGTAIAGKLLEIVRPILEIVDAVDTINEINENVDKK